MEILTKETINSGKVNDTVEGIVFMRYLKRLIANNGLPYLAGEIETKEKFAVIMWKKCIEYDKHENGYTNELVFVRGTLNDFGGKISLHLTHIEVLDAQKENIDVNDLKCLKYDKNMYSNATQAILKANISSKGLQLVDEIVEFNNPNGIWSRFTIEYAAKTYHDNCESGLLAHTYKCLRMLEFLQKPYGFMKNMQTAEIPNHQDILDLLYIGVLLHDVGKIYEMCDGIYQDDSFNTHRILGLQVLYANHDKIVTTYNEHWFQALISIMVGHHHEYGDKAKTIYAMIVYQIDSMEAMMTTFDQLLTPELQMASGGKISYNDNPLYF